MNVKQRIAVQASEYHKRNIQPYDFVISLVNRDKFRLICLLDDVATLNARILQINPNNEYVFVYEIEKRVFKLDYNAGLPSNYEPPLIEEETKEEEGEHSTQVPAEEQFDPFSHDEQSK